RGGVVQRAGQCLGEQRGAPGVRPQPGRVGRARGAARPGRHLRLGRPGPAAPDPHTEHT
ncbi:hypothetical protein HGM15179_021570, partial [Zosterops borbonicus]